MTATGCDLLDRGAINTRYIISLHFVRRFDEWFNWHRTEQHHPCSTRLQRVQQSLQPLPDLRQTFLALDYFVRAIRHEDHRRLQFQRLVHELVEAGVGLVVVEAGPRFAEDGVAAPAEIAEREVHFRESRVECRLPV